MAEKTITTRYGNKYTQDEWDQMQEMFKAEYEYAESLGQDAPKVREWMRKQLTGLDIPEKAINYIITDVEEYGQIKRVQFRNADKRAKVEELVEEFNQKMNEAWS